MSNSFIPKSYYLSFFWKVIIAVSIATITASAGVVYFGKLTLDKNYSQERKRVHRFYNQAFESTLQRYKRHEVDIGWLIPAFVDPGLNSKQALLQINDLTEKNWFKIELNSDIQSAYLFSKDKKIIGQWGGIEPEHSSFSEWLDYVIANEKPVDRIECSDTCIHYFASPFLHQGDFIGVFIIEVNLSEIVLQMKTLTGADIGILVKKEMRDYKPEKNFLSLWSQQVVSLTTIKKTYPLLTSLMKDKPEGLLSQDSVLFNYEEKTYEITALPFSRDQNQANLIIIEDISDELTEINNALVLYIVNGLVSLILSGGILLLIFIAPMRRLESLINLLPYIAAKDYSNVERKLPPKSAQKSFKDEIDVLGEATHNLVYTLKKLDEDVGNNTRELTDRTIELQQERNFVSNILNTAQVIIMTLGDNGKILTLNHYTEEITGYSDSDLLNRVFLELIPKNEIYDVFSSALDELINHKRKNFRYECFIYTTKGSELYISWYLTRIDNNTGHPEILVVGLDLSERRKMESQLTWVADHDPLTNLFNRRRFDQEFRRTLSLANRYNETGALIFFDIDHFKNINDSSGHSVGDELLLKIAEKLVLITRESDIIARFGGDEFVVLAQHIDQQNAEELVKKICHEMTKVEIYFENIPLHISVSAGLLIFPVADSAGYSDQDLMASVDMAMYKAKAMGRGGWCMASINDLQRTEIRHRVNWKSKIEKALEEDRFVLYYQPIMKITDKSISHYECLLRMIDENGEIILPGLFTGIAEQSGLISKIDLRVLDLAFKNQAKFMEQGLDIILSINLSGEMLSKTDTFNSVNSLLNKWNVPASKFIFEVIETQAVTNLQSAHKLIQEIAEIGGHFALDDFGVGFSSMSYLKQLSVRYLKIDGGFIKNLADSEEDHLFVKAINNVGQGMGLITIAEFVEDEQIMEILSEIGVDYAQGYAIGKPKPDPEFHKQNPATLDNSSRTRII